MRALGTATILGIPLRRLLLLIAMCIVAINFGLRCRMLLQHRTDLGGVEHNVVHGIQKVMLGQVLYDDPTEPPFDVIQYTPLYYAVCAGAGKLLGLEALDARSIFLLNRTVALFFNLVLLGLVYRLARVSGASRWTAILAACFSFATLWEQAYGRMDALSGAAVVGSFLVFAQWLRTRKDGLLVLCAFVAVFAALAKQSGVIAMAIPLLYVFFHRQWRSFWILGAALLFATTIAVLFVAYFGRLTHAYQHLVGGLANGTSWMMWQDLFAPATYKYFIGWHVLAVIIAALGFRSRDPHVRFLALAVPVSLLFAMITGLKSGSRLNYLHESLTLTYIATAVLIAQAETARLREPLTWAFALYGCLFAAFRTNSALAWYRLGEPDAAYVAVLRTDMAVRDTLLNELHLQPDEYIYITERDNLEHFFVGQSLLTQKDIVRFSKQRLFDYSEFFDAMQNGTVRFVITKSPVGPISMMDSTFTGWVPIRTVGDRTILTRSEP
ncbi:MAG TPA: hypothetical protein PLV08_03165 [Flavobacteriales bacterium]|jgi:hypothetical protein|nr:hypothetical protein [Flavobacteriales bacterium]HQW05603.1 hypothetical protein [Flavobacteriales bacterium]HQW97503.1 hypothetical protein [Flavobacteriales bacterium]HQX98752.1 hypothetical protein [Flavobacteriales bacterium]